MKTVNIYKATCGVNGKIYIGQTVQKIRNRWNRHVLDATKGSQLPLSRAIMKHGKDSFTLEKISEGENESWGNYLETLYILIYDSTNPEIGYNLTHGGEGGLHLPETKVKIGEASKAWWSVPENKERASKSRKGLLVGERNPMFGRTEGRPHTEETKKLLSETRIELFKDPEFKARMSEANKGKHHTETGRANISEGLKGNQYRKGIPHDEETKARIAASMRASWDRKNSSKTFQESLKEAS
jgi:group I intron endonuclease